MHVLFAGIHQVAQFFIFFGELDVTPANADNPTEAEQWQAAGTLASIEGTNLYDAVVENINGCLLYTSINLSSARCANSCERISV